MEPYVVYPPIPSIYSPALRSRLATVIHSLTGPSIGIIVGSLSITAFATVNGVSRLHK